MQYLRKLGALVLVWMMLSAMAAPAQQAGAQAVDMRGTAGFQWNQDPQGCRVAHVYRTSPAERSGLRVGDVVVAINSVPVHIPDELTAQLWASKPGSVAIFDYLRAGEKRQASVTLVARSNFYRPQTFLALAEKGDAVAQFDLASMYAEGEFVPRDPTQALLWSRKSAEQGNIDAMLFLGDVYHNGTIAARDDVQAVLWFRKAADLGNGEAQFQLGLLYYFAGHGVGKDFKLALEYFRKAAEQGLDGAEFNLGVMYNRGEGMKRPDHAQAVEWFRKSAEHGFDNGMQAMYESYRDGNGVKKDTVQAEYWKKKHDDSLTREAADELARFHQQAVAWRTLTVKPEMSEAARKQRVLAESYLREKDFKGAIEHYEAGVQEFSSWPEGWFNLALLYGETGDYAKAANRMNHYLELAPDSPDAASARDKVVIWEDKAITQPRIRP